MNRIDKNNYYLDIAEVVSERGTCLRTNYGAVIVKNDEIISTGYTGSPRGRKNCCEVGNCKRNDLNIQSGERYELCESVHAEMNAIISSDRNKMIDSTLYLVGICKSDGFYKQNAKPCMICEKLIINAGIKYVCIRDTKSKYRMIEVKEWIK